jgi:hypothetical protein
VRQLSFWHIAEFNANANSQELLVRAQQTFMLTGELQRGKEEDSLIARFRRRSVEKG